MLSPPTSAAVSIVDADLANPEHQKAIVDLIDDYARDPMGGGAPLSPEVKRSLIPGLRNHPTTHVFLAHDGDAPVGVLVGFLGFSTFYARPLLNIHDLGVLASHRGRGVGTALIAAAEAKARQLGCCKLTLEVLENNQRARAVYAKLGFAQAVYGEGAGGALFFAKPL
jgi:ribosomal protein S18 acetylase RimI-like enzyme